MILGIVLALVSLQRVAEVIYAEGNTRKLLACGGVELGREQYSAFVALHVLWLLCMWLFIAHDATPNWWLIGVFVALQIARIWVLTSLGPYWTTRLITFPGVPPVRRGPYRFMRHPNYAIVAGELAVLPLAFHAPIIALAFTLANVILLSLRIRAENAALALRR